MLRFLKCIWKKHKIYKPESEWEPSHHFLRSTQGHKNITMLQPVCDAVKPAVNDELFAVTKILSQKLNIAKSHLP